MGDLAYALARAVLVDAAQEIVHRQTYDLEVRLNAKIQDIRDMDTTDQQAPGSHELRPHSLAWFDQMPVGLNNYGVPWTTQVEDRVGALRTPPPSTRAAVELPVTERSVTLELPIDGGCSGVGDGRRQNAIHYIAPDASRSTAAKTSSNRPARSRSIGFSPLSPRFLP